MALQTWDRAPGKAHGVCVSAGITVPFCWLCRVARDPASEQGRATRSRSIANGVACDAQRRVPGGTDTRFASWQRYSLRMMLSCCLGSELAPATGCSLCRDILAARTRARTPGRVRKARQGCLAKRRTLRRWHCCKCHLNTACASSRDNGVDVANRTSGRLRCPSTQCWCT